MAIYLVFRRFIGEETVSIDAESEEEARSYVAKGHGIVLQAYPLIIRDCKPDEWEVMPLVEKKNGNSNSDENSER